MIPEQENDHLKDASSSNAAADNARELEQMNEAERAARPSYELEGDDENVAGEDADRKVRMDDEKLESVEEMSGEDEETLSGSTNLSLDQLKKEHDPAGYEDSEDDN